MKAQVEVYETYAFTSLIVPCIRQPACIEIVCYSEVLFLFIVVLIERNFER